MGLLGGLIKLLLPGVGENLVVPAESNAGRCGNTTSESSLPSTDFFVVLRFLLPPPLDGAFGDRRWVGVLGGVRLPLLLPVLPLL